MTLKANAQEKFVPRYVVPPGETIRELLDEHNMTQAELARRMERPESTISQIINGKKRIEPETALQLEDVLGMPAHFWVTLEANYRLNLARQKQDQQRETEDLST
jgi:HTH-type transcriptional regulator / antitoxin HigA